MLKSHRILALKIIVALSLPCIVMAQGSVDDEINTELDRLYDAPEAAPQVRVNVQPRARSAPQPGVQSQAVQVQTVTQQPVVIAQPMSVPQVQYAQKQPTTYIEASPLTESKTEKLRRSRQDAELQTEQKIVEKLELSRMDDEQRRADALFGDKFDNMGKKDAPRVAPVAQEVPVQEVPVQVVSPVVAPVAVPAIEREVQHSEITAGLSDLKRDEKPEDKSYFGLLAGIGDYPKAVNVTGQYALGFSMGKRYSERMILEGSLLYSNYRVEQANYGIYQYGGFYPRITEMDQYSTALLLKYQLLNGLLRPVVGGAIAYTYRSFTDTQFAISDQSATSHAIDLGLMTGADIELSESFSLGLDFRYMWNMTSRVDNGFQKSYQQGYLRNETPIERLNYYTLGIVGRSTF